MNMTMQKMVLDHMRLAYKVSWSFHGCGIEQEDLNSIAVLGLVKAVVNFDPSKGCKFATFAVPVIRNDILIELRKMRILKGAVSLDAENLIPGGDGDSCTLMDLFPYDERGFDQVENSDLIPSLLQNTNVINEREKSVLTLVVCNGVGQVKAGEMMGVSQSYISRVVDSGLKKIRKEYFGEKRCSA